MSRNEGEIWLKRPEKIKTQSNLRITFVHTPMSNIQVEGRNEFWEAFDRRYFSFHPEQPPTKGNLYELPHWTTWLGGVLVDQGFSNQKVIDFFDTHWVLDNRNNVVKEEVKATLREYPSSDVYLFSPMTSNLHHATSIADAIKESDPNCKIIFGGIVATQLRKEIARHPSVDYIVHGRGEVALPMLLDAIQKGQDPDISQIGNLTYERNGELRESIGVYEEIPPSELPFPKVDLFPSSAGENIRYIRQVHRLGCPYQCSFCTTQTIGREPSSFPVERNLAEIDAYHKQYGEWQTIYWGDETFDPVKALPLLTALKERGNVTSDFQTRIGNLTKIESVRMLKKCGFVWAEMGVETGDQTTRELNKGPARDVPDDKIEEIFKMVRDEGIAVCLYTVNGLPPQSPDEMKRSADKICEWIQKGIVTAAYHSEIVPYPGSGLYDRPEQYGIQLLHKDYSLYNQSLPPVFVTKQAKNPDEVYKIYLDNLKKLGRAMCGRSYFG